MRLTKRSALLVVSGLAMLSIVVAAFFALGGSTHAATGTSGGSTHLSFKGTTTLSGITGHSGTDSTNAAGEIGPSPEVDQQIPASSKVVHVSADFVPRPDGNAVVGAGANFSGFAGLNHVDSRLAHFGEPGCQFGCQFSLEPPDQGLCTNGTTVFEAINDVVGIYNASGTRLSSETLNRFFGLADPLVRGSNGLGIPGSFGPFTSDPKCYFDAATNRWFVTMLEIDVDPSTGAFAPHTHEYIAVSTGKAPTTFNIFVLDTTNDGSNGTPDHSSRGCPCLGDQPLIGADANGFYVSTNEFPLFGNGFNGAQIYAFSKAALESTSPGAVVAGAYFDTGVLAAPDGGIWYSIQPATTPPGGSQNLANGGTEYFLSALDFSSTLDNRIAQWTLTNTSSLNSTPNLSLVNTVVASQVYGFPPNALQKNGPIPLGASVHNPEELLAGNDDRMNQVVYANGHLYSAVNTVVQTPNGPTRVGIAYFIVDTTAHTNSGGYVSVNQNNLLFPSIGVNKAGGAVMTFTLVGPDYFPSAAYTVLTNGAAGDVHIAGAGAGADDGFTGYKAFGGAGVGRWGDYSAAVAAPDGSIWMAVEYIPGGPRTSLANWGTFISHVQA